MSEVSNAIDSLKQAMTKPNVADAIAKAAVTGALTTGQNLVWYDLEAAAKVLVSGYTPLRKYLPRVAGDGGVATHWNGVTALNVAANNVGLSEGRRNAFNTTTTKSYTATYATIGHDDYVTFQLEEAAKNFDDAKALAVQNLLLSVMLDEEAALVGANNSVDFGKAATPSCTENLADGGSITNTDGTLYVAVVYLTNEGWRLSSAAGANQTFYTCVSGDTIPLRAARTNATGYTGDYNTGYAGQISDAQTVSITADGNNDHTVSCTVTPATAKKFNTIAAYAWFWGLDGTTGCYLGAITTVNSYKITTDSGAATTITHSTTALGTDYSQDSKIFDGLISIIAGAGPEDSASVSGATISRLAVGTAGTGTILTSNAAAGVTEINSLLKTIWSKYRLSPTDMWAGGTKEDIDKLVIAGGGAPLVRLTMDMKDVTSMSNGTLGGSMVVGQYVNPYGIALDDAGAGRVMKVHLHPFLAPGKILFTSSVLPYKFANVGNPLQVKCRRDYYQIEWPLREMQYEYGVYASEVLQCYAPISLGMLTNVANVGG